MHASKSLCPALGGHESPADGGCKCVSFFSQFKFVVFVHVRDTLLYIIERNERAKRTITVQQQ